ncbi:MAG: U32 family peptidase [Tenericutes bacterium]|nr:U32 family peptidase [Mycoplasmatota bacterium]
MVEILSPAGDLERLKWALTYGADAVYIGGYNYSLRANANNFSIDEIKEAVTFAHNLNKKVYVTVNILFHNEDLKNLDDYLIELSNANVDAFIVSDMAVIKRINELKLKPELHISTQESSTNKYTIKFWENLGATRVVLGRECSKLDMIDIKENTNAELEVFIHGAMCTSYSGRCVLSNYVTKRDSNRGGCSQVCRFTFNMDDNNDFQIASKDLSMIDYLEDLINIGVSSLKIEGRMRSMYYIATVVDSYKKVRDMVINNTLTEEKLNYYKKVLNRVSNRENRPQFFDKEPGVNEQYYTGREEASNQDFLGLIKKADDLVTIEQRNNFKIGDEIEVFGPNTAPQKFTLEYMVNEKMEETNVARHPREILYIKVPFKVNSGDILRVPID